MAYPNRTHSISEGPGTNVHLGTLYTNYLKAHCPSGCSGRGEAAGERILSCYFPQNIYENKGWFLCLYKNCQ